MGTRRPSVPSSVHESRPKRPARPASSPASPRAIRAASHARAQCPGFAFSFPVCRPWGWGTGKLLVAVRIPFPSGGKASLFPPAPLASMLPLPGWSSRRMSPTITAGCRAHDGRYCAVAPSTRLLRFGRAAHSQLWRRSLRHGRLLRRDGQCTISPSTGSYRKLERPKDIQTPPDALRAEAAVDSRLASGT